LKIRIAHVQMLPLLSGVQNMMLSLLGELDRNTYDITVISKPEGPLVQKVIDNGYRYLPLKSFRRNISFWDFIAFFQLLKIFRKENFDIVHTHSSKPGFIGRIAAKLAGCKAVLHTVHGLPFNIYQPLIIRTFYYLLELIAARFGDKAIFVNNTDYQIAIRSLIYTKRNSLIIYNGVKQFFEDSVKKENEIIEIGSAMRFSHPKNAESMVKASIIACGKTEKIHFTFIGDGEDLPTCKKLVEDAAMGMRIIFPGWVSDVNSKLKEFDVFVLFSIWEAFPISILEAMQMKLPIIGSDVKGINELVSDENGYLVESNNITGLSEILAELPEKRGELIKKGKRSYEIVNTRFRYETFIQNYKKLYKEVLNG